MNFLKKTLIWAIGFSLMVTASLCAQDYLDNALYVKFKEGSSICAKKFQRDVVPIEYLKLKVSDKKMSNNGFHREARSMSLFDNPLLDRTFQIRFDSTVNINKIIRILENDPNVESVERVPIFKLFAEIPAKTAPNDPYWPPFEGKELLWYLKMVNAEGAWALQQGDPNIKVAVVDGAVWGEHPDLGIPSDLQYDSYLPKAGNSAPIYSNPDIQCTSLYDSDPRIDPCPVYTWSHGTHCAGVVGAKNNNGIGISSLASGVTLMGVRATSAQNPGSVSAGYEGIRWAANNGAKVISCSWGSASGGSDVGNAMLKACYDENITIVVAAGNDNIKDKGEPASSMYVITVGSVDENRAKSSFSNYGNWVDITAPGGSALESNGSVGVVSTTYCLGQSLRIYKKISEFNNKRYDEMSGTSMATPLVASLCGLMLSKDSTLTPAQIKDILQNTSTPVQGTLFTPLAGIIDAEAALKAVGATRFGAPVENLTVARNLADTIWLRWDRPTDDSHEIEGYRVFCNGVIVDSCTTETTFKHFPSPSGQNIFLVSVLYKDGFVSPRKEVRAISPDMFDVSVLARPAEGGSVTGGGRYADGSLITLSAVPNDGYRFVDWNLVGNNSALTTRPSYSFRIRETGTYVARFERETANEQAGDQTFSITPNPAHDKLKVCSPAVINRISVCDLQGRMIKQTDHVNAQEWTLDVEGLENGTYIIVLQTSKGTLQQKFIKL